jgi:hypothetical protein
LRKIQRSIAKRRTNLREIPVLREAEKILKAVVAEVAAELEQHQMHKLLSQHLQHKGLGRRSKIHLKILKLKKICRLQIPLLVLTALAVVRSNPRELTRKAQAKRLQVLLAPKPILRHQVRALRTHLPTMSQLKLVKSKLQAQPLRTARKSSLFHLLLRLVSEKTSPLPSRTPMRKSVALLPLSLLRNRRDAPLTKPLPPISMTSWSLLPPIRNLEVTPILRIPIERSQFLVNRAMLQILQKNSNLQ